MLIILTSETVTNALQSNRCEIIIENTGLAILITAIISNVVITIIKQ